MAWTNNSFNTNPVCAGVGPLAPPAEPFKTTQLVVAVVVACFMFVTTLMLLYQRRHRRRLRIRSLVPIIFGGIGGMIIILIRASYDYIGREYFPCWLDVVLFYLVIPICIIPDSIGAGVFLAKQYQRQKLNQAALQTLESRIREKSVENERRFATPTEFFQGLHDYYLSLFELLALCNVGKLHYYHPLRKPSPVREAVYEIILLPFMCVAYIIGFAIRVATVPQYQSANQCTGCIVDVTDVIIVFAINLILSVPLLGVIYKVRAAKIPDPFYSVRDIQIGFVFALPILIIGTVLLAIDPGQAMMHQRMDWNYLFMIVVYFYHVQRSTVQLIRTRRIQREAEKNITLLEVLCNPRAALLFEKHLIAELANENLLFWREGIKYKHLFDHSDFDFSQQTAKVLWRTFLSPHASLPINISDSVRKTINDRFKGFVGKGVFDDALAEVYLMMQNGAFQRFIHSEAYKEFVNTKADYSLAVVNPEDAAEGGLPYADDGVTHKIQSDIREYIRRI